VGLASEVSPPMRDLVTMDPWVHMHSPLADIADAKAALEAAQRPLVKSLITEVVASLERQKELVRFVMREHHHMRTTPPPHAHSTRL